MMLDAKLINAWPSLNILAYYVKKAFSIDNAYSCKRCEVSCVVCFVLLSVRLYV